MIVVLLYTFNYCAVVKSNVLRYNMFTFWNFKKFARSDSRTNQLLSWHYKFYLKGNSTGKKNLSIFDNLKIEKKRRSKASFVLELVIFIFLLWRHFGQEAVFHIHLHYKEQKARGYYFWLKHSFYMKMRPQRNGNWRTKWDWKLKIYI